MWLNSTRRCGFTLIIMLLFDFSQNSSNVENLSPHVIKQVTKELNKLVTEQLEGIKVLINDEDVTNIEAVIEGPG